MTVSTTTAKVSYTGNGSTTAFAVPFVFFGSGELEVIERTIATGAEVVKTLTTHYTVTGGDGATGTVTALSAPASTVEWHIRRKTARTQLVDYQANDAFPADTHERALDRAAARDQEIEETVGRALVFPRTDSSTLDPELPASVDRASMYLAFDADGNPVATAGTTSDIVATPFAETLLDDANAAAMRATLGLGTAAVADTATQAQVDAGTAGKIVEADELLASRGYGRGFRNFVVNGGQEVWQRGAGGAASIAVAASTTAYASDRFYLATGANQACTVSQQAGLVTGSRWCARVQRNSGQTGTGVLRWAIPFDLDEIVRMRGKVLTLSMWLRAGANWSPTSGTLSWALYVGTGSVAKRAGSAYTSETSPITGSVNLTAGGAAAQSVSISTAIPTTATQVELQFYWTPTGTAGSNDYFEADDIQLEDCGSAASAAATAFERLPWELELAACQRHYWKSFAYATAPAQAVGSAASPLLLCAISAGANQVAGFVRWPVPMRVAPTTTTYNPVSANAQARDISVNADCASTALDNLTTEGGRIYTIGNASSVATSLLVLHAQADAGI